MIGLRDALILAHTKLKSKRLMLIITIIISGLMFGVLYAATILVDGITKTANNYTRLANDGQYLVRSTPILPSELRYLKPLDPSEELVEELEALQTEYFAEQKAIAQELGIPFDQKAQEQIIIPSLITNSADPSDKIMMVNRKSPVYNLYLEKKQQEYIKTAPNKLSDLKAAAEKYGAIAYYKNDHLPFSYINTMYLTDGKEDLTKLGEFPEIEGVGADLYSHLTASARYSSYAVLDDALVDRYILPANDKRRQTKTAIPVIITTKEAAAMFGEEYDIPEKPKAASEQIAWMKNLQQKVNGATYQACYRNPASIQRVNEAIRTRTEIEKNKDAENYTKPSLIYDLPTDTCGAVTVREDTRTSAEKEAAERQVEINKAFGRYEKPARQLLTFQVVGVMHMQPRANAMESLPAFMSELLGSRYDVGAIVPKQMFEASAADEQYETALAASLPYGFGGAFEKAGIHSMVVAFPDVKSARAFMENEGCPTQDPCGKPFALQQYGSNYLLVDDLEKTIAKLFKLALPIALAIAGIIIWAMMMRVIIDSRRETAVFRAIGAKRLDVMKIYLLYSFNVAVRIAVFAALLGLSVAITIQLMYGAQMTDYAKVAYGVFNDNQSFGFIGFGSPLLWLLVLCIVGICLLAVLPPLLRNVRRNPINDMREE